MEEKKKPITEEIKDPKPMEIRAEKNEPPDSSGTP